MFLGVLTAPPLFGLLATLRESLVASFVALGALALAGAAIMLRRA